MDQVTADFIKTVSEIMQLFSVMTVVAQHIGEQSQSFFRRGSSGMAVGMRGAIRMSMDVSVSVMLVSVCYRMLMTVSVGIVIAAHIHTSVS